MNTACRFEPTYTGTLAFYGSTRLTTKWPPNHSACEVINNTGTSKQYNPCTQSDKTGNKGPEDTYPELLQGQLLLNRRTNQLPE